MTRPVLPLALSLLLVSVAGCGHEGTYTCMRYAATTGEACSDSVSCVEGNSCVAGICERRADVGERCDLASNRRCLSPYVCEAGVCAGPRRDEGRDCEPEVVDACAEGLDCLSHRYGAECLPAVEAEDPCAADGQCPSGSLCVAARCQAPPEQGQPCSRSLGCADGLTCVDAGVSRLLCQRPPRLEGDLCGHEGCPDGMRCVPDARGSVCATVRGVGDPCDGEVCADGSYCSAVTDRCEPIHERAQLCTPSATDTPACADGLVCQAFDGVHRCAPPAGEGESCRGGRVCGDGMYCDRDVAPPELGFCNAPGC